MLRPFALLLSLLLPSATAALRAGTASPQRGAHTRRRASMLVMSDTTTEPLLRIGHGYDIHRMAPREGEEGDEVATRGQPMVIGGVRYDGSTAPDFALGCVANSDGDVIYHSVVDAILGALTMPDIGQLFPDGAAGSSDWAGADSEIFMVEAYKRMRGRGYEISNVDVTLICEKPRVNVEHAGMQVKLRMRENVARLLHTDLSRVNVKARTHEKVDSVGLAKALECHVVLIMQRSE